MAHEMDWPCTYSVHVVGVSSVQLMSVGMVNVKYPLMLTSDLVKKSEVSVATALIVFCPEICSVI